MTSFPIPSFASSGAIGCNKSIVMTDPKFPKASATRPESNLRSKTGLTQIGKVKSCWFDFSVPFPYVMQYQNTSLLRPRRQNNTSSLNSPMTPEDLEKHGPLAARAGEILAKSIILWKTRKMRKRDRVRLPALTALMKTIQQRHMEARAHGLKHYERIYNVALFVLLIDQDIAVVSRHFALGYRTWEKRFAARQLAIILHEVPSDLAKLLGGDFRKSLMTFPLWNGAIDELNQISKLLHTFEKDKGSLLKEIRHLVGAHRDHDAAKQLDIIETIEPLSIYRMAVDLYDCINPLVTFLVKVTELMALPHTTISHLLETPEFQALSKRLPEAEF